MMQPPRKISVLGFLQLSRIGKPELNPTTGLAPALRACRLDRGHGCLPRIRTFHDRDIALRQTVRRTSSPSTESHPFEDRTALSHGTRVWRPDMMRSRRLDLRHAQRRFARAGNESSRANRRNESKLDKPHNRSSELPTVLEGRLFEIADYQRLYACEQGAARPPTSAHSDVRRVGELIFDRLKRQSRAADRDDARTRSADLPLAALWPLDRLRGGSGC